MEDFINNSEAQQTQQQKQSLLSSKMINFDNNSQRIKLISNINNKHDSCLLNTVSFKSTKRTFKSNKTVKNPPMYSIQQNSNTLAQKLSIKNTYQKRKKQRIQIRNIIKQRQNNNGNKLPKVQTLFIRFIRIKTSQNDKNSLLYEQQIQQYEEINGEGYLLISDGRIIQGSFCQGIPQGSLKITFSNGLIYYGPVYKFKPHGIGSLFYPKGQKQEGEFCYGEFHGQGCFYGADGKLKRKGEWKRGQAIRV